MGHKRLLAIAILCSIFMMATTTYSEEKKGSDLLKNEAADDSAAKRELLLMEEIPVVVVTPAKVAQPILESPSTITVITREDIEQYGLASISDILRNASGVDVMYVYPTDRNVSIRGFNKLAAGKILSLVDGIPVYLDFYSMTVWELIPISVDEIERIEIIRGPGSALYGSNAFDGVVNMITTSTDQPSTRMTARMNQYSRLGGSIIHNGRYSDLSYKMSLSLDTLSKRNAEDKNPGECKF